MNEFVGRVSAGLAERGHRVVVAAPASSRAAVRESRRVIRAAHGARRRCSTGPGRGRGPGATAGPPVLAVGSSLAMPRGPRPRAAPVPIDLSRPLDELLGGVELDVVHVHDPFAPSAASVALRHSRSLNVGSFHEPSERVLSTQVARPLVEVFFGRLDARTVEHPDDLRADGALLSRHLRAGRAGGGSGAGARLAGRRRRPRPGRRSRAR